MCSKSDRAISVFLGGWNLVLGPTCLLISIICISKRQSPKGLSIHDPDIAWFLYCCVLFVASILHILSGILILFGISRMNSNMLLVGLILSIFCPFALLFTIVIPVLQCFCLIRGIRYYKSNWESSDS
ncbi:uncharacterized protein LOC117586141 [Drosophila guanche]|uniref:uncharacterized protein LOC117586141 n=1 Tax=Drosophila guanche TaxID=7266 RepID=UPI001470FD91|nr:uncharacterized protein LOC117586141 [Drosophila guanche]